MVGQANTVPAEQRRRERLDVQLRGRVKLDSGFQFDVKVRNFNAWGANIEAPQNLVLPETFELTIFDRSERRSKKCIVHKKWQRAGRAGVEIMSSELETLG